RDWSLVRSPSSGSGFGGAVECSRCFGRSCRRRRSEPRHRFRRSDQTFESGFHSHQGFCIAEQPERAVKTEQQRVKLECELLFIQVGPEVTFVDRNARGLSERRLTVADLLNEHVSNRSGTIVELDRRGNEDAAAR